MFWLYYRFDLQIIIDYCLHYVNMFYTHIVWFVYT